MAKKKTAPEVMGLPVLQFADRQPGRPKGSKSVERPEAILRPAQCPRCKSTRREAFRDGPLNEMRVTMQVGGETFNHQLWRNTKCVDCGQNYRVIEYRFEPPAVPAAIPEAPAEEAK